MIWRSPWLKACVVVFMVNACALLYYYVTNLASPKDATLSFSSDILELGVHLKQKNTYRLKQTVTNIGKREIEITRLETDCGCTLAIPEKKVLMPSESMNIDVMLDTVTNRGKFVRNCTLYYRHSGQSVENASSFQLSGRIVPEYEVNPSLVVFEVGQSESRLVTFSASNSADMDVHVAESSNECLSSKKVRETRSGRPGERNVQQIVIAFDSRKYLDGFGNAHVSVATGNAIEPFYRIDVVFR